MKKSAIVSLVSAALLLSGALPAAAQTNYWYPSTPVAANGSCIVLTAYQTRGSTDWGTGGQVTALQQFLNRTGYLSGVSGVFDVGTYGAVVNFQIAHGIPSTGTVGPITRQYINQQGCGVTTVPNTIPNNIYPQQYPYQNGYAQPVITSFSASAAAPGSVVTIYGSNLTNGSVTVYLAGNSVNTSFSNNNITFTVPYITAGIYSLRVQTGAGSSNLMSFTVTNGNTQNCGYGYSCACPVYNGSYTNTYPNYNNCGNGYNNGYNGSVSINSFSTTNAGAGQSVTIYGNGFTSNNNSVYINGQTLSGLYSNDGTSLTFVIPNGSYSGSYSVTVTNGNGIRSNALTLTVNGSGYCTTSYYTNNCNGNYSNGNTTWFGGNGQPSISSITGPTSVRVNSSGTYSVWAYTQTTNSATVRADWGDNTSSNSGQVYGSNQQQVSLTHAYSYPGSYTIRFTITDTNGAYAFASLPVSVTW